jgi:hypothetical protein
MSERLLLGMLSLQSEMMPSSLRPFACVTWLFHRGFLAFESTAIMTCLDISPRMAAEKKVATISIDGRK